MLGGGGDFLDAVIYCKKQTNVSVVETTMEPLKLPEQRDGLTEGFGNFQHSKSKQWPKQQRRGSGSPTDHGTGN
jgi:hypothetical protein